MRLTEDVEKRIKNVNIVIDSESNKRVFSNILQAFQKSTAKDLAPADQPNIWRMIFRNPLTKLAAAALIIIAVSFFSIRKDQDGQEQPGIRKATQSPAQMMTAMSLTIAYRKGGMEEVEEQYNKAYKLLGPRPGSLSAKQIFAESNGT